MLIARPDPSNDLSGIERSPVRHRVVETQTGTGRLLENYDRSPN